MHYQGEEDGDSSQESVKKPLDCSSMAAPSRTEQRPFRIVVFSSSPPQQVSQIVARLQRHAPEAKVCGVLYELLRPKTLRQRLRSWRKKASQLVFWRYVTHRILTSLRGKASRLFDRIIRFVHAAPANPNGLAPFGLDDLRKNCSSLGSEFLITNDIHSHQALKFVRGLKPDLGLVFGTRILKPSLFEIPRHGSINIHKRKVPDYRGGGPVGLWELLDKQSEIGVTVHRVEAQLDVGPVIRSTVVAIEPSDDLESLALKANVVASDLIIEAVCDFARGTVAETPQTGPGKVFRNPPPEHLLRMKKQIAAERPATARRAGRPRWKLLAKSLLFVVPVALRNWNYRRRKNYPVLILFHHLVSDRPHPMGVPTSYFLRQLNYLLRHYKVVSLSEAVERVRKGGNAVPTVAVTFDDGYAENFLNLRAATEQTNVPIAYFVVTENVSTGTQFAHDISSNHLGFQPNTWPQIRVLKQSGYEIGSHTRNHADCRSTDIDFLRYQIVGSGQDIEEWVGPTPHFSFPFGRPENISPQAAELACRSYPNVFSAYGGSNFHGDGSQMFKRYSFPRTVWELELQLQGVL
jgi:peptidoglycan/xylan/chitin deacetylase (PgdA/CDA1 family)